MKTFITARSLQAVSIFFVLSSLLHAQDPVPSDIYRKASIRMDVISPPLFPGNTENIVNFGAKGDGIYDNTKAISDAIESVSRKGGGTVIVPEGMWFTGPIVFKSNINLRLESGAFVLFTPRKESYPVV
jgi:polygalacturonase